MLPLSFSKPPKVSLAHLPTPIRRLERLSNKLGFNIWLKSDDLSGFTLSGNKVRKLEYLLADARAKGADTIITCGGIQSNHCRATAFACAQLGLGCHLILREDPGYLGSSSRGQANHFLDQLAGATFELHAPSKYLRELNDVFSEAVQSLEQQGKRCYRIPTGGSNGLGVWGYVDAAKEIHDQCGDLGFTPNLIVCATGSGGTQAGLILGSYLLGSNAQVQAFAVCDDISYFDNKVRSDIYDCTVKAGMVEADAKQLVDALKVNTNDQYIGPGYAKAYQELYSCISELAQLEGVMLDPVYTGKAFYGMLTELSQMEGDEKTLPKNVIFVHTGGAFGLFPHAPAFTT